MKIKIVDWNAFEKSNGLYFTRDINIVNNFNVYAMELGKKEKRLLVYMDFISFKYLGFINFNDCIEVVDNKVDKTWIFNENFIKKVFTDDLYYQKYSFKNIFAPAWMFDSDFLVNLYENPIIAEEEFFKQMEYNSN